MPNQYVNKVVQSDGTTLIDISDSTAVASDVAQGKYFYLPTGEKVQGAASGGTAAISVVDTTDSHGGTIRTITALDISDTTAVAADVAQGKYFYTAQGVKTAGTGSGGGGATQHTIHLEFTDGTDTDIEVDYDDSWIGTVITAYTPTTYGAKTVDSAALDGTTWYTRPTETWETLYNDTANANADTPYNYFWLSSMQDVYPTVGSVWRITFDNGTPYVITAKSENGIIFVGNPKYSGGTDDGSSITTCFANQGWGAWVGDTELSGSHAIKIERQVTA